MDELWKSVLAEIEIEISNPIFQTFFKGTQLVSLKDSVATVSSPTHAVAEYIERRYYALVKNVLDKKTGENVSILFVTQTKKPQMTKGAGPLFAKIENQDRVLRPARIRQDYTFDTFAVSDSNQLAYTAAFAVAANPGKKYNPLYLYGAVGVGKTHLMHSVANKALDKDQASKVIYLTTEEFTNEVVEAIRDKSTSQLRRKFRNADLLLLDDVQFLTGKEKVQEELFHTFNTLIDKGRQVIFSSDRPPSEIKKIEIRLESRFEGGLTIDIQPPDFELRTAILLIKSKKYGIELPLDMAKVVAEKIIDSRALEGFLLKLASRILPNGDREVTKDVIYSLIGEQKQTNPFLHPESIVEAICKFYNIRTTQLKGVKRDAYLVKPRQICMYLLKEEANLTFVEVGNLLGGRDHTTIMHGVEKMRGLISKTENLKGEILFIKKKIQEDYQQQL